MHFIWVVRGLVFRDARIYFNLKTILGNKNMSKTMIAWNDLIYLMNLILVYNEWFCSYFFFFSKFTYAKNKYACTLVS